MRIKIKAAAAISLLISVFIILNGYAVCAEGSYHYNSHEEAVPSRAGYSAVFSISGSMLGCGEFSELADIFSRNGESFFLADKGNGRIVEVSSDFKRAVREYSVFTENNGNKTSLSKPEGIFVSDDDLMYIADTGNSRIIVSDMQCHIKMIITKPESPIYKTETFKPRRVIADKSGNIYSIISNITGGAAFFNSSGEFKGYYGANSVEPTAKALSNYFKKLFATDSMRAGLSRSTPAGITGFDIDRDGFVYTVTESSVSDFERVKKVNAAGVNLFADMGLTFGDLKSRETRLIDIDADDIGRICCLDMETGRIFQYDENGSLLFIMGEQNERLGGFSLQPTALESIGGNIYVTDGLKNTVTIFEETNFGKIVHSAAELYNDGLYDKALEPWQEALRLDGNYRIAYLGMSASLLSKGDYKGAMEYAELGGSSYHYNKAFERYRVQWLDENFTILMLALIIPVILLIILMRYRKKTSKNKSKEMFLL